jgi:hypothetical protein
MHALIARCSASSSRTDVVFVGLDAQIMPIARQRTYSMSAAHHYHAVVWIDHREARVFHFGP